MSKIIIEAVFIILLVLTLPLCLANEIKITYDANGNVVSDGQFYREYNGANQLYRIRNGTTPTSPIYQEFTYDPIEERIVLKKTYTMAGAVKETVFYFSQDFVRVINSSGTFDFEYAYLDGQMIAQVNPGGTKLFMETDQKGDVVAVTNASGKVIENTSYSPFGEVLTGGKASRFGYEAQEHDTVVGDTDFHARKYSPSLGIFLQPDTLLSNVYDPQQLNRYTFEKNSPSNNEDPSGHCPWCAAAVAGFIMGSFTYMLTHEGYGWSHVMNTWAAGGITAGVFAGGVAFASVGANAAAESGVTGTLTVAGKFLVGAAGEAANEALEGEDPDYVKIGLAGALGVPGYGLGLKPGTFMGTVNSFSSNNLKAVGQQLIGSAVTSIINSGISNSKKTSSNNNGKTALDKLIEKNQAESAKKEAAGLKFTGYGSDKNAIWVKK
jgi:RHS repeat-associated protein